MRLLAPTSSPPRGHRGLTQLQHIAPCVPCVLVHRAVWGSRTQQGRCSVKALEAVSTSSGDAEAKSATWDKRAGRSTYRPASFKELVEDAASSVIEALGEGSTRLEVEFPVLPGQDVRTWGLLFQFIFRYISFGCRVQGQLRRLYRRVGPARPCRGAKDQRRDWQARAHPRA